MTNAGRVRRALRCFKFSKNALLVAEVIVERTVAMTPERWTTTLEQKEIMDETSLSKSRVSEAIAELELTRVILRDHTGRGEFTVTLNPPISPLDGHILWSARRANRRYIGDEALARVIEGQPVGDVAGDVAGAQEMPGIANQDGEGETGPSDQGEVPPVGTSSTPVSGKEIPESPVSGKPVSGNPVLPGKAKPISEVPPVGPSSADEILEFARERLPSEFMAEHGGLIREFCRECRPAVYETVCAYLAVHVKPHDLRGWFVVVYRRKRNAIRKRNKGVAGEGG
jgi:hypothetical protein